MIHNIRPLWSNRRSKATASSPLVDHHHHHQENHPLQYSRCFVFRRRRAHPEWLGRHNALRSTVESRRDRPPKLRTHSGSGMRTLRYPSKSQGGSRSDSLSHFVVCRCLLCLTIACRCTYSLFVAPFGGKFTVIYDTHGRAHWTLRTQCEVHYGIMMLKDKTEQLMTSPHVLRCVCRYVSHIGET